MRLCLKSLLPALLMALPGTAGADSLQVGVSVLPLEALVESIGGDVVEVKSLQEAGDSCSIFEPRPSAIRWPASSWTTPTCPG